jgi:outer membrane protein OmpA-like peptidoglycan-associated protein
MTKCARILVAVSFVLMSYQAFSQKKEANNGNSEQIKQEAVEMRNKVNKYMSEKLILNEAPSSASESLSNTIIQQRAEIDKLMERLQKLEMLVNTQLINNSKKIDAHHYSEHATIDDLTDVVPGSYAHIGEKKLLLFYAFDSHRLNAQQVAAIKIFLYNKDTSSIQVNAFTDIFGSENYNNKLAAKRCKAAIKYIPGKKASINITPEAGCGLLNRIDSRKCRRVELILSN